MKRQFAKSLPQRVRRVLTTVLIGLGCLIPEHGQCGYSKVNACIANLKQIDGAKQTWALEYHKPLGVMATDADLFGPDRYIPTKPVCPGKGTYTAGKVGEDSQCSIKGHSLAAPMYMNDSSGLEWLWVLAVFATSGVLAIGGNYLTLRTANSSV